MKLKDKVALITGGGKGIGKATATAFAREGADVAVCARTQSDLEAVVKQVEELGRQGMAVAGDVSHESDCRNIVQTAVDRFGGIDILVNSAGVGGPAGVVAETPVDEWDRTIAVNLRGVFLMCRQAVPHIVKRKGGKVINVASTSGLRGFPKLAAYCSSKFAVVGFTQCLARELAEHGVCVNALCPGPTETPMAENHWPLIAEAEGISVEQLRASIVNSTPQKRILPPEEVAAAAVFLASSDSDGMTGTEVVVSGGFVGA